MAYSGTLFNGISSPSIVCSMTMLQKAVNINGTNIIQAVVTSTEYN